MDGAPSEGVGSERWRLQVRPHLHEAFGPGNGRESELSVELMGVLCPKEEAETGDARVLGGHLDQEDTQPVALMGRIDEHVAQPGKGRSIGDPTTEADLGAVLAEQPEIDRRVNCPRRDVSRAVSGPVTLGGQPLVDIFDVDQ